MPAINTVLRSVSRHLKRRFSTACVWLCLFATLLAALPLNPGWAAAGDSASLTFAPDVVGTPYAVASAALGAIGVIKGYPDGTFRPSEPVTRAQMAVILLRLQQASPASGGDSTFKDVPATHWAAPFVAEAARQKLLKGYQDGSFRPDGTVTEMEALTVAIRLLGFEDDALELGPWPEGFVAQAVKIGLLTQAEKQYFLGKEGFVASSPASRGKVAVLAHRLLFLPGKAGTTLATVPFRLTSAQQAAFQVPPANTWADVTAGLGGVWGEHMNFLDDKLIFVKGTTLYSFDVRGQKMEVMGTLPSPVSALTVDQGQIYLFDEDKKLYVSSDGKTWTARGDYERPLDTWGDPMPGTLSVQVSGPVIITAVQDPFSPSLTLRVYALSWDGGRTWSQVKQVEPQFTGRLVAAGGAVYGTGTRDSKLVLLRKRSATAGAEVLFTFADTDTELKGLTTGAAGELYFLALRGDMFDWEFIGRISTDDGRTWERLATAGVYDGDAVDLVKQRHSLVAVARRRTITILTRLPLGGTEWEWLGESADWGLAAPGGDVTVLAHEQQLEMMQEPFTAQPPVLTQVQYMALPDETGGRIAVTARNVSPSARFWVGLNPALGAGELWRPNKEAELKAWVQSRVASSVPPKAVLTTGRQLPGDQVEIAIPNGLKAGLYWVGVQNPDGQTAYWPGAFSVGWLPRPEPTDLLPGVERGDRGLLVKKGGELLWLKPESGDMVPSGLSSPAEVSGGVNFFIWGDVQAQRADLVAVSFYGTRQTILTRVFDRGDVAFTPDGEWVYTEQWRHTRVVGFLLHGGVPVVQEGTEGIFSPRGDRIAITGDGDLVVYRLSDLKRQILHKGDVIMPTWSPDGEHIAFLTTEQKVAVRSADGRGPLITIPTQSVYGVQLFWSPDGRLYVKTYNDALFSVLPDGTDRRVETRLENMLQGAEVKTWKP